MTRSRYILGDTEGAPAPPALTRQDIDLYSLDIIQKLSKLYRPPADRRVTPERVHQPAVTTARDELEAFTLRLLTAGSGVEGLEHLDHCLSEMRQGRKIVFLAEHRGNLDVPSFNGLVRAAGKRYEPLLDKLIYIAGRKLSESSDFINMFAEKYSRLVIVPRREFPDPIANPTEAEKAELDAFEKEARRINWAAFRAMEKLKRDGYIFVLFPTGGRIKPNEHNQPVRETTSYVKTFETAYLISMEGNALPPQERMEDERPIPTKVLFRVSPPRDTAALLDQQKAAFEAAGEPGGDLDQYIADNIIAMLARLRETGHP